MKNRLRSVLLAACICCGLAAPAYAGLPSVGERKAAPKPEKRIPKKQGAPKKFKAPIPKQLKPLPKTAV